MKGKLEEKPNTFTIDSICIYVSHSSVLTEIEKGRDARGQEDGGIQTYLDLVLL